MYNYCTLGGNTLPPGKNSLSIDIFRKDASKYANLVVELYVCDNFNEFYRFKKNEWHRESYEKQYDFTYTFMIMLC